MKKTNIAMNCCTSKKCKHRIITETTIRTCPLCGSMTRKEKKFRAEVVEIEGKDDSEFYIILKEKGHKVNDSNKRKTTKNKKRELPWKPYRPI